MPVVNRRSNVAPRAIGGTTRPDPQAVIGRTRVITGTITNAADDFAGSTFWLADVPSDCYLDPSCEFAVSGWGFATVSIGIETDNDALGQVARSAGPSYRPHVVGDVRHGVELWQVLGLPRNPGGHISLFAHAIANATAAGSMPFRIAYIHRS